MDDEIFIYENLIKTVSDYKLSVRPYNFRDVVMLVFHEFMEDYNKNSIFIEAEEYYERVRLDFRTTRFVLYHIIGNSSKYTKPNTNIKVSFDETNNHHVVKLKMTSYYMTDEQKDGTCVLSDCTDDLNKIFFKLAQPLNDIINLGL